MANADFEKQNTASGGFSADSYRRKEAKPARSLTPFQQKLAKLEKAMPAALKVQAVGLVIALAAGGVGLFGIGGAKLAAQYRTVESAITMARRTIRIPAATIPLWRSFPHAAARRKAL